MKNALSYPLALVAILVYFSLSVSSEPQPVDKQTYSQSEVRTFYGADVMRANIDSVKTIRHDVFYIWPVEGPKIRRKSKHFEYFTTESEALVFLASRLKFEKKLAEARVARLQKSIDKLN